MKLMRPQEIRRKKKMNSGAERLDKDTLTLELNKIYELKSLLEKSTDFQEEVDIIDQLSSKIKHLEGIVSKIGNDILDNDDGKQLDSRLKDLQSDLKKAAEEYDDSCRKMRDIIEKQNKSIDNDGGLLSDEEIHNIRLEFLEKKIAENRKSILIKNKMDEIRKKLENLQEEIFLDAGDKKKDVVKKVKLSLDNIEFLYFLDNRFIEKGLASFDKVPIVTLNKIKKNMKKNPEKIVNSSIEKLYIPGEAPKDMMISSESFDEKDFKFGELSFSVSSIMKKLQVADTNDKSEYEASNIHVSESFLNELKTEKCDYDIFYSMPHTGFVSGDILLQLSSCLIQTDEMRDYALNIKDSIIKNLSEDEIDLLLDWYKKLKKEVGDCPMIHDYIFEG